MKHPFDGLINPNQQPAPDGGMNRRGALGAMLGVLGLGAAASAQVATTLAIGEEGGGNGVATTRALNEEGAATRAANETGVATAKVTTEPFGEEAGKVMSNRVPGLEDGAAVGGGVTTDALNEEGAATGALNEAGGPILTQALRETGVRGVAVAVKPGSFELPKAQLDKAWNDLASPDAGTALQGSALLYGHKDVFVHLKDNLKLDAKPADEKEIAKLIADLDDRAFATREKADMALEKLGMAALPALQAAMEKNPSMDLRKKLERLLEKSKEHPDYLRASRGVEVLVALQTPEARKVLETLSKAKPETVLTKLAGNALNRMGK